MVEEKTIVRVVAQDRRYTKSHYQSYPVWKENWNTFLTGQHIDPDNNSTHGYLTLDQMQGKSSLTPEQMKMFKYVINPDNPILIKHNWKLDITVKNGVPVNDKDYWEYTYLKYQNVVARTKEDYNVDEHRFYIEDQVNEAKQRISKRDTIYKAVEKVRANLSMEKLSDLALLFNYYIPKFRVDVNKISKVLLEDMVYEQCEKEPEIVLKCFSENSKMEIYILKLADKGIIKRQGNDFYDMDSTYLGQGIEKVQAFMTKEENRLRVNKWSSLMKNEIYVDKNDKSLDTDKKTNELLSEGLIAVLSKDKAKIAHIKNKLSEIGGTTQLEKLIEAEQIQEKQVQEERNVFNSEVKQDMPSLLTLKQTAGRLGINKEVYQSLDVNDLQELIEKTKQELGK